MAGYLIAAPRALAGDAAPAIYTGVYEEGAFQSLDFVNSVVGWETFFYAGYLGSGRVIANVEAGLVWDGHDWFARPDGAPAMVPVTFAGEGALAEYDFHATMVGHVLAGAGYIAGTSPEEYSLAGLGMAPMAQIWSGAIATSYDSETTGSFSTETATIISVYRTFFEGIGGVKPDAINSSWGGGDTAAILPEAVAIDGLARDNPTVVAVSSAGNTSGGMVTSPGSTYNGITVGSVGGTNNLTPSDFSAGSAADFYNPDTGVTYSGVRAAVDLAAPGENFVLAAYLGQTGSLAASEDPAISGELSDPSPTDWYFYNESGTSFSSPIVAGGITLLRDAAENDAVYSLAGVASASDARVLKSILMAGAAKTVGWDNGQTAGFEGIVGTTQALDYKTGAGALNLDRAVEIYLLAATRDLAGDLGGNVSSAGWDFANIGIGAANEYFVENPFAGEIELTVSLNWFAGRVFDGETGLGEDLSFSDLNLEVWSVEDGKFLNLVAFSRAEFNNTEFLRLDLPEGSYGIRVTFEGMTYGAASEETYAVAWRTAAIPEPSALAMLLLAAAVFFLLRRVSSGRGYCPRGNFPA